MRLQQKIRETIIASLSGLGVVSLYVWLQKKHGPLVRTVVFHDVLDADWFRTILVNLERTYAIISPKDFVEGRFDQNRINILITFDDGYASWVDVCLPILIERNIKALFFINSGLLDAYEDREKQSAFVRENLMLSPRKTLSWGGVKLLQERGQTIGGHTANHARLGSVDATLQEAAVVHDKKRIEAMLGTEVTLFAYPFGQRSDYTNESIKILERAGYTHAFTTESGFTNPRAPYTLARLCLYDMQPWGSVNRWVRGGYDMFSKLKSLCVR